MSNAPDRTVTIRMEADDQLTPTLRGIAREFTALNAAVRDSARGMAQASKTAGSVSAIGIAAQKSAQDMDKMGKSGEGMSRFEKRVAPIGGLVQKMGDAAEDTAKKYEHLSTVGTRMAMFGTAVAVGMGMAVKTMAEFDKAMARVAANSGETGAGLQRLRDEAVKVSLTTAFSATEAADGMNELTKAGVKQADILGGALVGALSLAAAGEVSVAEAAELAATAMNQFGLSGAAVPRIADLLAAGANNAQGSVHDLGFAFRQAGLQANAAGMSVADTTGTLTAFASAGLIGSDAGTSLKTMLQRMTPESEKAAATIRDLGIEAYDAQGEFVGIVKYSEKLRDGMKNLTPEARNAAMAIVFGQDAVRAANILYQTAANGGLQAWIDKTNDAAFATRNAAILQNHLTGDLKKLKNSLDALVLESGGGVYEFLRSAAQAAKLFLDGVNAIPAPVLQGVAAFAAWAAITTTLNGVTMRLAGKFAGLGSGLKVLRDEIRATDPATQALIKRYQDWGYTAEAAGKRAQEQGPRINYLSGAMRAAGGATTGFKAAAGGLVAALGGPWGIAIGAATAALGLFAAKTAEAKQRQAELEASTQALAEVIAANNGVWDENASRQLANQAVQKGLIKGLDEMGVSMKTATDGLVSNGQARQDAMKAIDAHIDKLTKEGLSYDANTGQAIQYNRGEIKRAEELKKQYEELIGAGSAAAAKGKEMTDVNGQITGSAQDAAGATGEMAGGVAKVGLESEKTKDALKEMDQAIKGLLGSAFNVEEATDTWITSLDELAKSTKEATAGLDANTAGAAKNRDMMRGMVKDGANIIQSMAEQGKGQAELQAEANKLADAFVNQAIQAGFDREAVERYAEVLRQVPTKAPTEIVLGGIDSAMDALTRFGDKLHSITDKNVTITYYERAVTSGRRTAVPAMADGGIFNSPTVRAFAHGGFENHTAQIAPAGAWRIWAEPETGGEAYVPLAKSKRRRSVAILEEVARRFGMGLVKFAEGGITRYAAGGLNAKPVVPAVTTAGGMNAIIPVTAKITKVTLPKGGVSVPFLYTAGGQWDRSTKRKPMNTQGILSRFDELYVTHEELTEAARKHYEAVQALANNAEKMVEKTTKAATKATNAVGSAEAGVQSALAAQERVYKNKKSTPAQRRAADARVRNARKRLAQAKEADRKARRAESSTRANTSTSRSASVAEVDYYGAVGGNTTSGSASAMSAARSAGRAAGSVAAATTKEYVNASKRAVKDKTDPNTARAAAIMNALSMNGRGKYVYGGGHQSGYYKNDAALAADCSGFVGWAIGHALNRNVTGTARTMLSGKTGGFIRIDPKIAAKTAGAIMGNAGHVVMSLGDGRVIESYSKGKPVRIRKLAKRDYAMAAWNPALGEMTIGTAAQITGGMTGTAVVGNSAADRQRQRKLIQEEAETKKEYEALLKRYKQPAYVHLATATKQQNASQQAFLTNIRKIRDRGFPSLAYRLLEMGDEQGAIMAASLVNAPDKVLRQQRDMFEKNANLTDQRAQLEEGLSKLAGPAAYVTAGKEAKEANARRKQWMDGLAKINKVDPALAQSLYADGMDTSFDLVMSIKDKPAKDMRYLRHTRYRDAAALDERDKALAAQLGGPAWKTSSSAITKKIAASAKFMASLETLRKNGYADLARRYYDMGEEAAGDEAASMAAASNSERDQMRKVYAAQDESEKKWDALGNLLHGVGKVIDVAIGIASATDPAIRYLTPAPVDARGPSLQMLMGGSRQQAAPARTAPLLNVENLITENPGRAVTDMETKLGDAMAVTGLGTVML